MQCRMTELAAVSLCIFLLADANGAGQASGQDREQRHGHSWISTLPDDLRTSILWQADHEEGDLSDWHPADCEHPGGGVFNTGDSAVRASVTTAVAHSGRYSAEATITGAIRGQQGNRAVRLMRWTDKPWDKGGKQLPKSGYYSTWMFFPRTYNSNKYAPWDPGDGGWWSVFQFKSHDDNDVSEPVWTLNVYHDDESRAMYFGLYSHVSPPASVDQAAPVPLPVGRWFHVEAFYRIDADSKGAIAVWQDGTEVLRAENIQTAVPSRRENTVWGIGNYTDHITGGATDGTSTIFFDDAIISRRRVSEALIR